jgi:hypothetical protein
MLLTWGFTWCLTLVRTGERTPTGTERPSRTASTSGSGRAETSTVHEAEAAPDGARSHQASRHRATGQPGATGRGVRADRAGVPQLPRWERSDGVQRRHGQPGQRERRRGTTDRATGNRIPTLAAEAGQPADGAGAAPCRATGRASRGDGPGNRGPSLDSGDGGWETSRRGRGGSRRATGGTPWGDGPGNRGPGPVSGDGGRATGRGRRNGRVFRATGVMPNGSRAGQPVDWPKKRHRPPHSLGRTTGDVNRS